jgi:hypothetical protein
MSDTDLRELRALLRETVAVLRRPTRELERELGIGSGRLRDLLDGTLELRVYHLLAFARVLSVPPEDLLAYSCAETRRTARYRLANWLPYLDKNKPSNANANAKPAEPDQLREVIRSVIREELEQLSPADGKPRGRRKNSD